MKWEPIAGYEDRYLISEFGEIKAIFKYKRTNIVTPWIRRDKRYWMVTLWKDGKRKHKGVHVLVAEAFLDGEKGKIVRHLDGDSHNNHYSNLAYGSHYDNSMDAKRHGTISRGEKHGMAKLTNKQVIEMRKSKLPIRKLANIYNISEVHVKRIKAKKCWAHLPDNVDLSAIQGVGK